MSFFDRELSELKLQHRLRTIPSDIAADVRSGSLIDLCSNDYMGLAAKQADFIPEFLASFPHLSMSASASRLLAGEQNIYSLTERLLGELYGKSALLFNSGYHANVGIVQALNREGTLWLTDRLIHASAIDGIRLARAEFKRWHHNDAGHLRRIVESEAARRDRIVILCESVYSMDGDIAPLREIVAIKRDYPNVEIYLDEAHSFGVMGEGGLGLARQLNLVNEIDYLIGTFGKGCASVGAFVVASDSAIKYILNTARSFIFSTALPPVNVAWTKFMIETLLLMDQERFFLKNLSEYFRNGIEKISGQPNCSQSQIVPLITGDSSEAIRISNHLKEKGIIALPIRRPTVPPGGERIRFSLNANLNVEAIDYVLEEIRKSLEYV